MSTLIHDALRTAARLFWRVVAALALTYLAFLSLPIGTGGTAWYGNRGTPKHAPLGVDHAWLFWCSVILGSAAMVSAIGMIRTRPAQHYPLQQRVAFAVIGVGLLACIPYVVVAATSAAHEYEDQAILWFPGRWLGWVAVPLAVNAVVLIWFVLVPRIRSSKRRLRR